MEMKKSFMMEEWEKNLFIKLPNYVFREESIQTFNRDILNEHELIILAIMASNRYSLFTKSHVSINYLLEILGKYPNNHNKQAVKEAVLNLVEKGFITIYSDVKCTDQLDEIKHSKYFYVKIENKMYVSSHFTKIYFDELRKILELDNKNKMKIFNVYLHVVSRMFEGTGDRISFEGIETLADATGYDRKSVMKYLEILCENEILCGVTVHSAKRSNSYFTRKRFEEYLSDFVKYKYKNAKEYVTGIEWKGCKEVS